MNIAIIPARGGSKRIPRKNIKEFHGQPMIAYSINAAISSGCFDKIIVSTDDPEISAVARQYGADVPFVRPKAISDDYSSTMDVIHHALMWCDQEGWDVQYVCCLYATAPFLQPEYLKLARNLLTEDGVEYVFSATTFPFPIQRAIKLSNDKEVSMFCPENENVRSQDLEEAYHDAGQFYWGKNEAYRKKKSIFSSHSRAFLIPRKRAQDIDTPEDWEFAEAMHLALSRK